MTQDHLPWRMRPGIHYMPDEQPIATCLWLAALAQAILDAGAGLADLDLQICQLQDAAGNSVAMLLSVN